MHAGHDAPSSLPTALGLAALALSDGLWHHLPVLISATKPPNVKAGSGDAGSANRWAA